MGIPTAIERLREDAVSGIDGVTKEQSHLRLPDQAEREFDPQAQPAPDYEFDPRVAW